MTHLHHQWNQRHAEALRHRKAERLQFLLDSAEAAARQNDMSQLYHTINRLTPKAKPEKLQLRSDTGQLLGPTESFQMLCQYVSGTWHGTPLEPCCAPAPGVPFSESDLVQAVRRMKGMKSMAPHKSPGFSLNSTAQVIASHLMPLLQKWWNMTPPHIPQEWRDGWLFLLPKPSKKPDKPNNLRPPALQEGLGKAVLSIVSMQARQQAMPKIAPFPQFAYMQGRGCEDAIARAVQHCNQVISMKKRFVVDMSPPKVYGGVTLSIDLKQAFDTVPRAELFSGLENLGVHSPQCTLLRAWHEGTCYHITHKFQTASIPVSLGIRQGCVAAPFLWTCFTVQQLQNLARITGEEWVYDAVTLFADDILAQGQFTSVDECQQHLRRMGALLDLLDDAGMRINLTKTEAVLTIHGRNQNLLQSQCVQRTATGHFLTIPRRSTTTLIRLTSKCGYLGVQLSYGNLQQDTLQRRLAAGQMAYKRLTFWLHRKRGLTSRYRLAIWRAVVQSTLTYGTLIVGVTKSGLIKLNSTLTLMQRMILANHSYNTGQSHQEFFLAHQLEHPLAYIRCLALIRRQDLRAISCSLDDILHTVEYQGPRMILDHMLTMDSPDRWLSPAPFPCHLCDLTFPHAAQLTKHLQGTHHVMHRTPHSFRYASDAATGPPQCVHCEATFQSWTKLKSHVTHGYCPAYSVGTQGEALLVEIQRHFKAVSLPSVSDELLHHPHWLSWLAKHCIHCGRFNKCARTGQQHMASEHPEISLSCTHKIYQPWIAAVRISPCPYCQIAFKHSHQCNTLFQLASLFAAQDMVTPGRSATICLHCAQIFSTEDLLNEHLRTEHLRYSCIRDTVRGNPQCKHCGTDFKEIGSCNAI